jgi:DNA-3-methyladenine glycosylase
LPRVLSRRFYLQPPLEVARRLIGKRLVFAPDGERIAGRITETEAYIGTTDPACHAFGGRRGANEMMYHRGGVAYVYFTYGAHFMLNVVVGEAEFPAAILIRAVAPEEGIESMRRRRGIQELHRLTSGPGNLCRAFGIDKRQNGTDLDGPVLFIEASRLGGRIKTSGRIGIGDRWAHKRWRFYLAGHPSVSGPARGRV